MPHLGIEHEDERRFISQLGPRIQPSASIALRRGIGQETPVSALQFQSLGELGDQGISPEDNILSQSVADVAKPSITIQPQGISPVGSTMRGIGEPSIMPRPGAVAPVTTGITPTEVVPTQAPVLGDIDFSSIEGLLKGVSSVTDFTRNLQKFNRARGITPGKKGRAIKTSDIQNRIKFLQERLNEGFITEEEEPAITDELDILNQFIQSRLGTTSIRTARAKKEEQRRLDLEAIRAL